MHKPPLASARKTKGWTQAELARRLNITRNGVNLWEQGLSTPSPAYLVLLAKTFSVSTDYLLGLDKAYIISTAGLGEHDIAILSELADMLRERN